MIHLCGFRLSLLQYCLQMSHILHYLKAGGRMHKVGRRPCLVQISCLNFFQSRIRFLLFIIIIFSHLALSNTRRRFFASTSSFPYTIFVQPLACQPMLLDHHAFGLHTLLFPVRGLHSKSFLLHLTFTSHQMTRPLPLLLCYFINTQTLDTY